MTNELNQSKTVLLVGGASGIGHHTVDSLLLSGHTLHVATRDPERITPRPRLSVQAFDAADKTASLDVPDSLDGFIYFPGTIVLKPFNRLTLTEFENDMAVNFFGAVNALQQSLPALKRTRMASSSVVLFSSVAATLGMPFHASIAAAKAAIEGFARSLAAELAPRIRVNVVAPSLTDTPLAASMLATEERAAAAAKRHPLERVGDPAEVAAFVDYLIGDGSGFVSGQVFKIDGGLSTLRKF